MILTLVAIGEVVFWAVLASGLAMRYVLRRPRAGVALLCVPLIDAALLAGTAVDLSRGGDADSTHGLAYTYLGFTVAFGPRIVRWADRRFAHRFAGGPPPPSPPRHGRARIRHEWRLFRLALLAWAISCGLMLITIGLLAGGAGTKALWVWIAQLSVVVVIWSIWPIAASLRRPGP